ncbi:MAG: formylmethanofuran dehydrogenase subunit A [Candidatus Helarchaeota archaeon]
MVKPIIIKNGYVIDPLNNIVNEKKEIYIENGVIVNKEPKNAVIIDASGMVVMPGGVDVHSHIAGAKVNKGRLFRPEDHVIDPVKKTKITRSGTGYSILSTFVTGYRYAQMGYTTVIEPASVPLKTLHTHEEFIDIPIIDKALFPLMGNNWFVMKYILENNQEFLNAYVAWLIRAMKGFAVKIVNPGGNENWRWGKNIESIDQPNLGWEVTARQILVGLGKATESLGLPHTIHIHTNNLGHPGCYETTLESLKALENINGGKRDNHVHITHVQFNSYGGSSWKDFCSEGATVAKYINDHKHVSCDIGQVIFGSTTTMTADGPWEFGLQNITGMANFIPGGIKWLNGDVEAEDSSGVVPYIFRKSVAVNAIQWAMGLEILLSIKDLWRSFLTTDHPNGGPFVFYPKVISWLMSSKARAEELKSMKSDASEKTTLPSIDREMTLEEIAIITRAGTAKILGLNNRGHLGDGALGDVSIYKIGLEEKDAHTIEKAFAKAIYTIKSGIIVVKDGEIVATPNGKTIWVNKSIPEDLENALIEDIKANWYHYYSTNFANYPVSMEYLPYNEEIKL